MNLYPKNIKNKISFDGGNSYCIPSFLHLISMSLSFGEYLEESNTVYKYGLPELTRDILERIKSATGQPINTKLFFPILASSSKGYETIEHQPHKQYSKYLTAKQNEALEGGYYHTNNGNKRGNYEKDHYYELGEKGLDNSESDEHEYGDQSRQRHKFHEGRVLKTNHHTSDGGKKGEKYKKGRRHGKFHVEKGFRDIYHKDEEKKSDFYWNNQHEEGKWIEYGFKNKKSETTRDEGEEGRREKDKTEESSYEKEEDKCSKFLKPPLTLINNDIKYLHIPPQIIAPEQYQVVFRVEINFPQCSARACIKMRYLIIIWFVSHWTVLLCQENVKLVVITEINSNGIPQQLSEGIKLAEEKYKNDIKINMDVLPLIRSNEAESYTNVCGRMEEGLSALLDLTWSGWDKLRNLATDMRIPYVRVDITIRSFVKAMNDFLVFRNGTDSALIFDNEMEIDQALYYMIRNSIIRIIVLEKLGPKHIKGLRDMRPTASFHTIFASSEQITEMFRNATQGDIVKREGRWNLIFTDFKFDAFNLSGVKILTNLITLKKEICCQLLNIDESCDCPDNFKLVPAFLLNFGILLGDVLSEILSQNGKIESVKGECGTKPMEEYENGTDSFFIQTLTKLLVAHKSLAYDSPETLVHWKSAMDIHVANETQNTKLGTWSYDEGFSLMPGQILKPDKRFFRIGIIPNDVPWSYQEEDPNTGEMVWQGYCVDLAYKLSEMMNFDFEFSIPKSGDYGQKLQNGQWNGAVGDLARGETDIVIASLIMTSEREEVIDFVAPYFHQSGISIMIRKPVRPTSLFKFMTVLRVEVWVSILGALTVTGIMIWLLDKYSPYSARNNKEMYPYPCREFTLKESFWFALTSFTPQGGGEAPKALSGRTLVAAYWLFVVLMLATFTANLAAFLTVERMKSPVESLEQLARQSRINYSLIRNSDTHKFFINMKKAEDTLYRAWKELALNASSDETQYRVWDYPIKEQYGHILLAIEQTGLVENETEGIQKVLNSEKGEFAFIHNEASIKYQVYRNCNLTEVGEVFAERPYAIAVQQGSQLQEEISRRILDLQKDRYFETQSAKFWNSSAAGDCPNTDDSEGITLGSLGGVFIATLFGLALAMITLAGEILYHKHKDVIDSKFNQMRPQKKKKVEAVGFPSQISNIQRKGRITLGDSTLPTYRPTGPGKMMPRVSYISVFPKNQPIYD